jgi:hypothetical protein
LVKLADGVTLSSVAFDPDARALDLLVAGQEVWLASGDTARVGGHELVLKSVAFAGNRGVVFTVYDARFRPLLFGGFGLVLAAAFVALVRRNR